MRIYTFLVLLFIGTITFAQREKDTTSFKDREKRDIPSVMVKKSNKEFTVKGVVKDETNEPLIGVNIL